MVEDGLEAVYGPIPAPVANRYWYDEVIVLRVKNRLPSGRRPTPPEIHEILKLGPWVSKELSELCGVPLRTVQKWNGLFAKGVKVLQPEQKIGMSGYRGVSWDRTRKKWRATYHWEGRRINVGLFVDPKVAAQEREKALNERTQVRIAS